MPRPEKGSDEAKEWGKKMREARAKAKAENRPKKEKKSNKKTQGIADTTPVLLETVGKNELVVPQYYARKLAPSKRKPLRYRLVNPITQERHLATRGGESVVRISRRATAKTVILGDDPTPIPLSAFSKADREKVVNQFHLVEVNQDKPDKEKQRIPFETPKSRGRPTKLPKNIEWLKAHKQEIEEAKRAKELAKKEKKSKAKKPQPSENITLTIGEPEPKPEPKKEEDQIEKYINKYKTFYADKYNEFLKDYDKEEVDSAIRKMIEGVDKDIKSGDGEFNSLSEFWEGTEGKFLHSAVGSYLFKKGILPKSVAIKKEKFLTYGVNKLKTDFQKQYKEYLKENSPQFVDEVLSEIILSKSRTNFDIGDLTYFFRNLNVRELNRLFKQNAESIKKKQDKKPAPAPEPKPAPAPEPEPEPEPEKEDEIEKYWKLYKRVYAKKFEDMQKDFSAEDIENAVKSVFKSASDRIKTGKSDFDTLSEFWQDTEPSNLFAMIGNVLYNRGIYPKSVVAEREKMMSYALEKIKLDYSKEYSAFVKKNSPQFADKVLKEILKFPVRNDKADIFLDDLTARKFKKLLDETALTLKSSAEPEPVGVSIPEPLPPATDETIKDIKKYMDALVKKGQTEGLEYYSAWNLLTNMIFAGMLLKYGNKCFWSRPSIGRANATISVSVEIGDIDHNTVEDLTPLFATKTDKKGLTYPFQEQFFKHIADCVKRGEEVIVIPLELNFHRKVNIKDSEGGDHINYSTDGFTGHSNMLVYRPKLGTVERFEPHGEKMFLSTDPKLNEKYEENVDTIMRILWEDKEYAYTPKILQSRVSDYLPPSSTEIEYPAKIKYIAPKDLCPIVPSSGKLKAGLQAMQSKLGADIWGDKYKGFCSMWSIFFAELCIKNPTKTSKELVEIAFQITKDDPSYILQLIKGYTRLGEIMLKELFESLGVPDWSFKLEKRDRKGMLLPDGILTRLQTSKDPTLARNIANWFDKVFIEVNKRNMLTPSEPPKKKGRPKKVGGSGILDDLRSTFNRGAKVVKSGVKEGISAVKSGFEEVKDFASTVMSGRNDYQPKGRAILKKYGSDIIKTIELGRDPVLPALKGVLNVISGGEFGKRVEKANFDDLFHLFCVITLQSGKKIMTEKNEVIIISESIPARSEKAEYKIVESVPSITLQQLFDNNKAKMGAKYFTYSAKDNNCQDYLLSLLKASNIGTEEDYKFIKQDTKQLFAGMPYLRKFANSITGFAGKLDVILSGRGFGGKETEDETESFEGEGLGETYVVQSVIFDKDKWNAKRAIKWLKENSYSSQKVDNKENFVRFRQIDPDFTEQKGFTEYRNKPLGNSGIQLVIAYKKKISGNGIREMPVHTCEMCGGRISTKDVEKFFRSASKKVLGKKATRKLEDFGEDAEKYITRKKGGLATDLIDYGVPALTSAVLGGVGGLATGGVGGVAGSAIGSKIGKEYIAPALHKATGAGVGGGRSAWINFVKKVANDKGISYKEALSVASAMRKR